MYATFHPGRVSSRLFAPPLWSASKATIRSVLTATSNPPMPLVPV
jgi:hypothetical protein